MYCINACQAQLEALQAALSQEVALIQGPPGTGKVRRSRAQIYKEVALLVLFLFSELSASLTKYRGILRPWLTIPSGEQFLGKLYRAPQVTINTTTLRTIMVHLYCTYSVRLQQE